MILPSGGFDMASAELRQAHGKIQALAKEREGLYRIVGILTRAIQGKTGPLLNVGGTLAIKQEAVEAARFVVNIAQRVVKNPESLKDPIPVLAVEVKDMDAEDAPTLIVPRPS